MVKTLTITTTKRVVQTAMLTSGSTGTPTRQHLYASNFVRTETDLIYMKLEEKKIEVKFTECRQKHLAEKQFKLICRAETDQTGSCLL